MEISITRVDNVTSQIKDFEERGWLEADIEHYGSARPYKKRTYKFVAVNESGDITGILDLEIEANVAFIDNLLVGKNYRRLGVGKKLITYAERFAKKNKCTKIWLSTSQDWEATKFYEKVGYKITGTHEKHFLEQNELLFTKFF